MKIATETGKHKHEVEQEVPASDLFMWSRYFELKEKQRNKEAKKQDGCMVAYTI